MNGIIGMISLAKSRLRPGDEAMQYLNKADEVSAHLLALINDILDMSRIEAGKVELEHKVFSLRELGNRLYDMFAKQLQERGIHYEVNLEDMTVDSVVGDELRISQIIINFLSNAVKFTSRGEIIVTIRQMMLQDNAADLMFRVHDTGIGMDHAFLNRIFRPFEQESIETGRKIRRYRPRYGDHRPARPPDGRRDRRGQCTGQRLGFHRVPASAGGGAGRRDGENAGRNGKTAL